jgi:hypothetical protein
MKRKTVQNEALLETLLNADIFFWSREKEEEKERGRKGIVKSKTKRNEETTEKNSRPQ